MAGKAREKRRFISEKTDGIFFANCLKTCGFFLLLYLAVKIGNGLTANKF